MLLDSHAAVEQRLDDLDVADLRRLVENVPPAYSLCRFRAMPQEGIENIIMLVPKGIIHSRVALVVVFIGISAQGQQQFHNLMVALQGRQRHGRVAAQIPAVHLDTARQYLPNGVQVPFQKRAFQF